MLVARNLHKTYRAGTREVAAVADVTVEVARGEFVALCGRSGSGKSTLLALLGGLCQPTSGSVQVDGAEVWSLSAGGRADLRSKKIGFLLQFASLLPTLRAIDNVALPALLGGVESLHAVYQRASQLLTQVGLAHRLEAYPAELSGGEQRRVALARALIHDPPVLLADEPTSDLDEQTEAEVMQLLLEVQRAAGKTLVLVTHNPDIARLADRVVYLSHGKQEAVIARDSTRLVERPVPVPSQTSAPEYSLPLPAPAPMGSGLGRFVVDVGVWVVLVTLALAGLNHAMVRLQQSSLDERKAARQQLEEAALRQLRADVEQITLGPDKSYLLTIYLENLEPEEELHVLAPVLRAFVQVERSWEEVALVATDNQAGTLIALDGKRRFHFRFTPARKSFEELLPGYMHVRFNNTMLVRKSSDAGAGLFERSDDYYVYLKPPDASDEAILRKLKFPGKPPLWIPMPPH